MSKTETGQLAPKLKENPEITGDARIDELLWRLRASGLGKSVSASEWEEVQEHLSENIMNEDRVMREYNSGYKTGQQNIRDLVDEFILGLAGEAFTKGKDDEARTLRSLAKMAKEHVSKHIK